MTDKEYRQVSQIYKILQAPLNGGVESIDKKLHAKNLAPLKYACDALEQRPSDEEAAQKRGKRSKQFWVDLLKKMGGQLDLVSNDLFF